MREKIRKNAGIIPVPEKVVRDWLKVTYTMRCIVEHNKRQGVTCE
jgi:hypothetical protein